MPAKRKASSETSTAMAGFFLANGPAVEVSSNQSGEGDIRRALIKADREMTSDETRTTNRVFSTSTFELHPSNFATALSGQLIHSTQIPVCLWFLAKNRAADAKRGFRDRRKQALSSMDRNQLTPFALAL